jgi:hypothetical protein
MPPRFTPCFAISNQRPMQRWNKQKRRRRRGVARWFSFAVSLEAGSIVAQHVRRAILVGVAVSYMSKIVTPQQSEHVCPRGRPRGHPVIKYSIIDR